MDIRKELYRIGKNLTLFIEDITSFTGVDNALLNVLMEEHNDREICRISSIIGGTNAYINDCFRQNHLDRVTKYVYIPDDVFDENSIFEFVGRYINAMSLPEDIISAWLSARALSGEYPVHEAVEGKNWEYIPIPYGKQLCLYPFSKNSIRYLYKNELTKGQQTPRYIIRDIIEPVVSDLIYNSKNFPSIKYNLVNINTTLDFIVRNQIKDEEEADRVFRFMSIWGNNEAKQFKQEDITYVAGLPAYFYEELSLPVVNLQETVTTSETASSVELQPVSIEGTEPAIPLEKQKKFDDAHKILTQWANGMPINLATTGGTEGTVHAAREDMGELLLSAINWQIEGVSLDNVSKVKAAISGKASKYKLIALENQTKGNGYYILPGNKASLGIIEAFIRWREFGNKSWKYPNSDFDVYMITSWISRIKKQIIKEVLQYDENNESKYIEAAIAAEMYRLILNGEYREKSLKNLTAEYLLCDHPAENKNTYHSKDWNTLLSVMHQKDADLINKETVRQYFNLIQGGAGSMLVLDAINLSKTINKVKANKLQIPEEEIPLEDRVKLRKDTYSFFEDITSRIGNVAQSEIAAAKKVVQPIYDCFDDDEIEDEDIKVLLDRIAKFYKEIDDAQINIKTVSTDAVKKSSKQISKAISDIGTVLNEDDPLAVIMTFSSDPIGTLQEIVSLISQVSRDVAEVDKQIANRKNGLGVSEGETEETERYKDKLDVVESDIALLGELW